MSEDFNLPNLETLKPATAYSEGVIDGWERCASLARKVRDEKQAEIKRLKRLIPEAVRFGQNLEHVTRFSERAELKQRWLKEQGISE